MALTGAQIRAGRALLRWSAEKLALESKLGRVTINRAEGFDGVPRLTAANLEAIGRALTEAGVVFIDQDGGGPGVRLKEPPVD